MCSQDYPKMSNTVGVIIWAVDNFHVLCLFL
jgi:hypothetical protein